MMETAPSFYATADVLRIHPDWPLLRPRTPPPPIPDSPWTARPRTSSNTSHSSYSQPAANEGPYCHSDWPLPRRTSSVYSHSSGEDGYAGSLHELPWPTYNDPTSAFDFDSDEDKPKRRGKKLKKTKSAPKDKDQRHIQRYQDRQLDQHNDLRATRSADDETRPLSQGQTSSRGSTGSGGRKWSLPLPRMQKNKQKEKKPKPEKNQETPKKSATSKIFYSQSIQRIDMFPTGGV